MRKMILAAALVALTAGAAQAQQTPAAAPAAGMPHTADPARLAAARDLVDAMNVQKVLDSSITSMLRMQTEQNPALAQFEPTMREFFNKYLSWAALRDSYAQIYADRFTTPELQQIAVFYRSPAGQKMANATPELMQAGSDLGRQMVQAHLPELQAAIMGQMQTPSAAPGTPAPAPAPTPPPSH